MLDVEQKMGEPDVQDDSEMLATFQRQRCKDIGLIIFGFTLQEVQIEAIHSVFY